MAKGKDLKPMTAEAAAGIAAGLAEEPAPERFEENDARRRGWPAGSGVKKDNLATERLYTYTDGRVVLAAAVGDPVPEGDTFTLAEIQKAAETGATPRKMAASAIQAAEDAGTVARSSGDTYDRRALEQGLETEEQQKLAEEEAVDTSGPTRGEKARARATTEDKARKGATNK
jgi:hypothetical protein